MNAPTTATVLEEMSQKELLDEYNRLSPTKRKAKFRNQADAIKSIRDVANQRLAAPAKVKVPGVIAKMRTSADTAPPKVKGSKREPKNVRARMADVVIRITPPDGGGPEWNPHNPDTAAYKHFQAAKGGITVRQYLAKFSEKDQRTARQWLWNFIKYGRVKTLGA